VGEEGGGVRVRGGLGVEDPLGHGRGVVGAGVGDAPDLRTLAPAVEFGE